MKSVRGGLDRGLPGRELHAHRIEARGLGNRNRIDGTEAVDDIHCEEEWYPEPRFLCRDTLELARVLGSPDSEERPDPSGANERLAARRRAGPCLRTDAGQLVELSDLFVERHQPEDGIGELRGACGSEWRFVGLGLN